MSRKTDIQELFRGLRAGNIAQLSRAITLTESGRPEDQQMAMALIDRVLPYSGNSVRIGITGVPGVGKSTFIDAFGMKLIEKGAKVAVLAIDPSSSVGKGSILGDKTRMERLSVHPGSFIRPSATWGHLGGLTYKTKEAIILCEAAGYEYILVETVGVGQSETEVSQLTDFFLLLMLTGAGDELQGIKRGIMEMADAVLIHKADGDNLGKAKLARTEYARALHFLPPKPSGWSPKTLIASALSGLGIDEVVALIWQFVQQQKRSGYFEQRRAEQNRYTFRKLLREGIMNEIFQDPEMRQLISRSEHAVVRQEQSPYSAVFNILRLRKR
ncbi:MAG TPA: methylmalonyl Co-A mutase-associated GTPase MeaB [Edaphocola sp.]|nr:methylmalonyl Co-A mutase-associated GTPase MeaB [Edaphocola sp.]